MIENLPISGVNIIDDKYYDIWNDSKFDLRIKDNWQNFNNSSFITPDGTYIYLLSGYNNMYGGSSKTKSRIIAHKNELKKDIHANQYMQNVVNKYGISGFFYQPLFVIPTELVIYRDEIENSIIRHFDTFKNGYNLLEFAGSGNDRSGIPCPISTINALSRNYIFLNPKGEKIEIFNLAKFCRENNLDNGAMGGVYQGKITHHKGWRKFDEKLLGTSYLKRTLYFLNPEKEIVEVQNLKKFCKERDLSRSIMSQIINEDRSSHKGWTKSKEKSSELLPKRILTQEIKDKALKTRILNKKPKSQELIEKEMKRAKTYRFISPSGEEVIFKGMRTFCKANNLLRSNMLKIIKGRKKTHRGWTQGVLLDNNIIC